MNREIERERGGEREGGERERGEGGERDRIESIQFDSIRLGWVGSAGATCATDNRFATSGLDDARMLDRAV